MAAHDAAVWEAEDPDGRHVVLTRRRWQHIIARHPELAVEPEIVLGTVARPDRRSPGHEPREEWFYRRGVGPSRWIRVVVHFDEEDRGSIATAFPRRSFP